ncbi:MAG: methylamine utilization protein, partial [Pirellulaceae bacterium]
HPWMKASMMVCDHPYFAVTDADGSFSIPNVPAGVELEFRVWHEKAGYISSVSVDGASEKWSKGRFKRELADGDSVIMDVAIDASALQ